DPSEPARASTPAVEPDRPGPPTPMVEVHRKPGVERAFGGRRRRADRPWGSDNRPPAGGRFPYSLASTAGSGAGVEPASGSPSVEISFDRSSSQSSVFSS